MKEEKTQVSFCFEHVVGRLRTFTTHLDGFLYESSSSVERESSVEEV